MWQFSCRRVSIFTIVELLFREIKEGLDCKLKVCKHDELGRYVILKGFVQGQPFLFVNIYAPNKVNEKCVLYDEIHSELAKLEADAGRRIIIGGDFNVILYPDLDESRGKPTKRIM